MRIMFSAIPAYGHVHPLVPLAVAAVSAGHEVTFAASGQFAGRLPLPVIQGVPVGMTLHDAEQEAKAELRDRSDPLAWLSAMFGVVMPRHVGPRLLDHWDQQGLPDLVVHDSLNFGAALAAAQAGTPAIGFNIGLEPPESFLPRLHAVAGAPLGPILDPRPPTWLRYCGPSTFELIPIRSIAWSGPDSVWPGWLSEDVSGATAYVTLGTVSFGATAILRRSILAAADRCRRVLVAAGPGSEPDALGELPENVFVERYVDQARVLERVDVAIHHGGTGTVLGCLAAGVPQAVTPQGADQFLNAQALVDLQLGHAVRNDAPAGTLPAALEASLTDSGLRGRVRAVQDEIAAMPMPSVVLEVLVDGVRSGRWR